jgi:hypothetical protein
VKKRGRPGKHTDAIADEICARLSEGETLTSICRDEHMPSRQRVYEWAKRNSTFSGHIARAREMGFDAIADEILRIADTPLIGEEIEEADDGKIIKKRRGDMLGHRRLQVEARLKLLAKWCPARYGDSVAVTGAGGGPVEYSDTDRAHRIAAILAAAEARRAKRK